jgi:hypothetical protein
MKITERRLRQIIRETLLEEQYRIDESHSLEQLKSALKAAALSAGLTLTGAQLADMATSLDQTGIPVETGGHFGGEMNIGHKKMTDGVREEINNFIVNPNLKDAPKMDQYAAAYRDFGGAGRNTADKELIRNLIDTLNSLEGYKGAMYKG